MVSEAFVFHEGSSIRAISVAPDPDLEARWNHAKIPLHVVLPVLQGKQLAEDLFFHDSRLLTVDEAADQIGFRFDADEWKVTSAHKSAWPLMVEIRVGAARPRSVTFRIIGPADAVCEDLPYMVCHKGDPANPIVSGLAPSKELVDGHSIVLSESVEPNMEIDVWLPAFHFAKAWITDDNENTPLPGGPDLMLVREGRASTPCLKIALRGRRIGLHLLQGGGPRYKRPMPQSLSLMLCPPGDPSVVLAGWKIPTEDLIRRGAVTIPLPRGGKRADIMVSRIWTEVIRD